MAISSKLRGTTQGFTAQMMEGKRGLSKMTTLTQDVVGAFNNHKLHGLCLCKLGGHLVGLQNVSS